MGAVFPGLVLSGLYLLYILVYAQLNPSAAPKPKEVVKLRPRDWIDSALAILPALFLIMLVLGSIFFGIATPTESSGMGALGAMILVAIQQEAQLEELPQIAPRYHEYDGILGSDPHWRHLLLSRTQAARWR